MNEYIVPQDTETISAKTFLKQQGVSTSRWKSIKHSGTFTHNGEIANATMTMLKGGDRVSYSLPDATPSFAAEDLPLDIIFEDEYFLILNKPAPQLVHPVKKEQRGTVANAVLGYYQKTNQPCGFHPVHRLDRNTTGVLLIAKSPEMQHIMSTKNGKKFSREYLAAARGIISPPQGIIDAPIARAEGVRHIVSSEGKPAQTAYQTMAFVGGLSLLRLKLFTGRTHQIRVHLAYKHCPLLGDELYNENFAAPIFNGQVFRRQALHAFGLTFIHPVKGEFMDFRAELPPDMGELFGGMCQ